MGIYRTVALVQGLTLGYGKRQRDADHEHEERPDHIKKMQSLPRHMLQLLVDGVRNSAGPYPRQAPDNFLTADDPEHIEAAKAVQRQQAVRSSYVDLHIFRGRLQVVVIRLDHECRHLLDAACS